MACHAPGLIVAHMRSGWLKAYHVLGQITTTREKPSSSAGFGPISSAGAGATNKALQLTYSSSAGTTRDATTSFSSSVGKNPRYYYQHRFF